MEVNIEEIKNVNYARATNSSVFLDNFINQKYGQAKIYKAKKDLN